jgi:hypothetical protein
MAASLGSHLATCYVLRDPNILSADLLLDCLRHFVVLIILLFAHVRKPAKRPRLASDSKRPQSSELPACLNLAHSGGASVKCVHCLPPPQLASFEIVATFSGKTSAQKHLRPLDSAELFPDSNAPIKLATVPFTESLQTVSVTPVPVMLFGVTMVHEYDSVRI